MVTVPPGIMSISIWLPASRSALARLEFSDSNTLTCSKPVVPHHFTAR